MKNLTKFSALAAVLVATATYACADNIGSWEGTNPGFANTNVVVVSGGGVTPTEPTSAPVSTLPVGLVAGTAIAPNGAWHAAGSVGSPAVTSQWVSFEAGTGSGGVVAPNGYYPYYSTFTGTAGETGSITVLADDTTDVWLNGVKLQSEASGGNSTCQVNQPNCVTPTVVTLTGIVAGNNVLTFYVDQTNLVSTGLDFYGTVTPSPIPEPGTFFLLGTGLIGSAGALFRRMRS